MHIRQKVTTDLERISVAQFNKNHQLERNLNKNTPNEPMDQNL